HVAIRDRSCRSFIPQVVVIPGTAGRGPARVGGMHMRKIRLSKLLVTSSFLALVAAGTDAEAASCYPNPPTSLDGHTIPVQTSQDCIFTLDSDILPGTGDTAAGSAALAITGHVGGTVSDQAAVWIENSTLTGRIYNAGSITGIDHDGILIHDSRLNTVVPSGTISGVGNPISSPAVISAQGDVTTGFVTNFGTIGSAEGVVQHFNTLAAFDLRNSFMEGGFQNGAHGTIWAEGAIGALTTS